MTAAANTIKHSRAQNPWTRLVQRLSWQDINQLALSKPLAIES
jgi:hypothetical protein